MQPLAHSISAVRIKQFMVFLLAVFLGLPAASSQSIEAPSIEAQSIEAPSIEAPSIEITTHDATLVRGRPSVLNVELETSEAGIVQLQLFTADWKRQAEATANITAGKGKAALEVTVPADIKTDGEYLWQVVLYTTDWKKLAEASATKIRVVNATEAEMQPSPTKPDEAKPSSEKPSSPENTLPVAITPSGQATGLPEGKPQWVPPGDWELDWADEFSGEGEPQQWYPLLGYDPTAFSENIAKGLRWSGGSEESAWMYSTKSGNHMLNGKGQLVLRITCDKTQTNEHGPKVNAGYLLSGYPDRWDKTEPNNAKWAGRFVSPADGPLYLTASVRTDRVVGYSTWFAFWLFTETRAYNGNPADGTEIDVIEIAKGEPPYMSHSFNVANHWKESGGSESKQFNAASRPRPTEYVDVNDDQFHEYGIEWSRDSMKCYVDGKLYYTFTENIPTDPVDMMILLTMEFKPNAWDPNQGDGRTEGPFVSDSPELREMSRAFVDFVRVFRKQ